MQSPHSGAGSSARTADANIDVNKKTIALEDMPILLVDARTWRPLVVLIRGTSSHRLDTRPGSWTGRNRSAAGIPQIEDQARIQPGDRLAQQPRVLVVGGILLTCALMTFLSLQIVRVGLSATGKPS
jgi:hypothetical protein